MQERKDTIGVFFGSRSPEHDVSIITAELIISGLKGIGHEVIPVYLNKKGDWLIGKGLGEIKIFTDPDTRIDPKKFGNYYLDLSKSIGKIVFKKKGAFGQEISIDLAFPAFHGSYGEDGTIQGLFEILGVPYVGCDVTSSAIAMDKVLTKQLYEQQKIPTTKFLFYNQFQWQRQKLEIINMIKKQLSWPLFVKPACLGSSIGIAKARNDQELERAIEVALHYDSRFIVEEAVENLMDVTVAVLGHNTLTTSELQESVFSEELFSYEEKYLKEGGAQFGKAQSNIVIPARLEPKITNQIKAWAGQIFKLLGCSGIARVDFLYDQKTKKVYANEVNTLPGTLYHHLWQASGIKFDELLKTLVFLAQEKYKSKNQRILTFASDILKSAHSKKLSSRNDV